MADVQDFINKYFKSRDISLPALIGAAVVFAEKTSLGKAISGADKLELAKKTIPHIIDAVHSAGWITDFQRTNYKTEVESKLQQIDEIIEFAVDVANNPNLVQAGQWVKNNKCCKLALF